MYTDRQISFIFQKFRVILLRHELITFVHRKFNKIYDVLAFMAIKYTK